MSVINGNNLRIRLKGIEIINCRSVSLDVSNNLVEATTKPTNSWAEFISGIKNTVGSFEGLVDYNNSDYISMKDDILAGTKVTYEMIAEGERKFFGDAVIESFGESGGSDDVTTYSGSFTITGDLQSEVVIPTEEAFLIDQNGDFITLNAEGDKIILDIPI